MLDTTIDEGQTAGTISAPTVSTPVRYKGIAIVGSQPATVMSAPYHDPEWLIYMCSPDNTPGGRASHAAARPRVDQWFELHTPVEHKTRPFGYLNYVSNLRCPVWMRDKAAMPHFKGARTYPEAEFKAKFCHFLFTSSIAHMMAKAIYDCCGAETWRLSMPCHEDVRSGLAIPGLPPRLRAFFDEAKSIYDAYGWSPPIKQIALYGILQASNEEYAYQRAGTQYFIWEAASRGIKMWVASESRLFEPPPDQW